MNKRIICLLPLLVSCVSGANNPSDNVLGEADQDMISLNGVSLNGISLNGTSVNGTSMNGLSLTGVGVNGATSGPVALPLVAKSANAAPWTTGLWVGSTWTATASNGSSVKLRLDAATQDAAPNADLWFYSVSYQTQTGWAPVCGLDANNAPIQAVTVAGTWGPVGADQAAYTASTTQFTLACRNKTIAKCVEMGYKSYKGYLSQLETCVRLLRADYCGNGTSYTVDGTTLNLYDNVGVQGDTQSWNPEAEWGPSGAACINSKYNQRYLLTTGTAPACVKQNATCGTKFSSGTVLIDELPPGEVP
jgi:hypothetical protein